MKRIKRNATKAPIYDLSDSEEDARPIEVPDDSDYEEEQSRSEDLKEKKQKVNFDVLFKENQRIKRNATKAQIFDLSDSEEDAKPIEVPDDSDYEEEQSRSKDKKGKKRKVAAKKSEMGGSTSKRKKLQKNEAGESSTKKEMKKRNSKEKGTKSTEAPLARDETKASASENAEPIIDEKKRTESLTGDVDCVEWSDVDYLAEVGGIDGRIARNVVKLFRDENTIPFIARYRKDVTGGLESQELRLLKEHYDRAKAIQHRAAAIIKAVDKLGKWTPQIHATIKAAKSLNELEHINALFKTGSARSLAERARQLGLGAVSEAVLRGQPLPSLASLVDETKKGLENERLVRQGVVHIVADAISKDKSVFEKIRELRKSTAVRIQSTRSKTPAAKKAEGDRGKPVDEKKYDNYFDFDCREDRVKPHQILAINRGESQKTLSVKIAVPDSFERELKRRCFEIHSVAARASERHRELLGESFDDAYKRLIKPLVVRRVRQEMNEKAEAASIEVFAANLKDLLLSPPVRGRTVLGVDPGFRHGCKLAAVSERGDVLDTATVYPHTGSAATLQNAKDSIVRLVRQHRCTLVALGNGTACRETEALLTELIQSDAFAPLDVSYAIINEAGASVYSCSPEAKSEFPRLDPNLISAVSIARRLQDPLAELVKVEPKHLGVGMYQHDLPEKQLQLTLNEVVTETVSFVGVDVNTASHCLLKRVAGLNTARATTIIEWKKKIGPIVNRKQLLKLKGIGNKSYEQCAGFIRILPETALVADRPKGSKDSLEYLDQTWIHPESYATAYRVLKYCGCDVERLGSKDFIERVKSSCVGDYKTLADKFETNETTMEIILKGLTMEKGEDVRLKGGAPVFRKNLKSIDDLTVGTTLSGLVRNVTHFGVFIDIGVGKAALAPNKFTKGLTLSIGQRVEVEVISLEKDRDRIAVKLIKVLV